MRTKLILLTALLMLGISLAGCASPQERQAASMAKQMMKQTHEVKMAQIKSGHVPTANGNARGYDSGKGRPTARQTKIEGYSKPNGSDRKSYP